MNSRADLRKTLAELDLSRSPAEDESRKKMIALLDSAPGCFSRDCFPGHFTGSGLVLSADGSQALLHHHRFLDRWLQFGGHCDGDEDVLRVALRESEEESGISQLIVASQKPFDLDIHEIPSNPRRGEPAHLHYDLRWVFIAPENAQFRVSQESRDLRWFPPAGMLELPIDEGLRRIVEKWKSLLLRRGHQV